MADEDLDSSVASDKEFYKSLESLDQKLNVIYPLVLIAFGTAGNLITFYVYTRKCFRNTSFGFYYSCLALVDTLALCIGSLKFYLNAIEYVNLTTYSTFSCKFFTSSIYILAQFSAWIIVLTNIDRLILVISPHAARNAYSRRSKRKFLYIIVGSLGLVIFTLNVPNIVFLHISREYLLDSNNTFELVSTCELGNKSALYNNNIADIMDLFIFSLIPFAIMILSSMIISMTIFRSRVRLKQKYGRHLLTSSSATLEARRKKKKNLQFSFTILCTNFLFLLLNLPICLILLIRNFKREDEYFYESRVKLDLAFTIANILAYFNFSNSIIIHYCFNRLFRTRLKEELFCFTSRVNRGSGQTTVQATINNTNGNRRELLLINE